MKLNTPLWILLLCAASVARAQVPTQMSFQGRIELPKSELESSSDDRNDKNNGQTRPFDGTGRFKFSIVSSTGAVLWTNVPGNFSAIPPSAVSLPVRDGIFSVGLGDSALGMPPLTESVFQEPDRSIRVYFQAEIKHGRNTRLTPSRELLPAQKLLTVPFAFRTATAQQAISKPTLEVLMAGATIQGSFAIAQNAVVLGSAVVHGSVVARSASIGKGTIHLGPSTSTADEDVISFSSAGAINTTGAGLSIDASGGIGINNLSTGTVSLAAGGGNVGIGTDAPSSKLHVAAAAGETADVLVVSTGTSDVFRVNGTGEVRAGKYFGDGSALSGIAAGSPQKSWLRATRGMLHSTVSDAAKDAQCLAELGESYVAAGLWELTAYAGVAIGGLFPGGYTLFSVAGFTDGVKGGSSGWATESPDNANIFCVQSLAPLRFTRTTTSPSDADSVKDALCLSEFGPLYIAATPGDMTVITGYTEFGITSPVLIFAGTMNSWFYDGMAILARGDDSGVLACVHR